MKTDDRRVASDVMLLGWDAQTHDRLTVVVLVDR